MMDFKENSEFWSINISVLSDFQKISFEIPGKTELFIERIE